LNRAEAISLHYCVNISYKNYGKRKGQFGTRMTGRKKEQHQN